MLWRLQIENYALIDRAVIEFGPGFNVLSGETGSGKSIVVDALGQLLGERANAAAIRAGVDHAAITGTFASPFPDLTARAAWSEAHGLSPGDGEEITLRREIAASGRSRAFVDNQPVTLAVLRDVAERLGAVHAQGEALVAFTPAEQIELLDRFAGADGAREQAGEAFVRWRECSGRLRTWQAEERVRGGEAEFWRFQLREIETAAPQPGEDEALEQERGRLANAERIAAAADAIYNRLYDSPEAVTAQLKAAARQLQEWLRYDQVPAALLPRIETLQVEARDIAEQVRDLGGGIEASPERLRAVEDRLGSLDHLKRKFGPGLGDVIAARDALAAKLDRVENAAAHQSELVAEVEGATSDYRRLAGELSAMRRGGAARLEPLLVSEAAELGMQIRFRAAWEADADVEPAESDWSATGWDRLRLLVSANPGEPLQPVERVASGGELSRLLLALHVIAERGGNARGRRSRGAAPTAPAPRTLVLDEIDTGVGGRAAEAVGAKLRQLGDRFQVLCVTHLAQIATFAVRHLHVEKRAADGRTRTEVRQLDASERVEEIARMLAGNQVGPTALRHARELLAAHAGSG